MAKDHFVPQLYLRQFGILATPKLINVVTISPYRFFTGAQIKGQCQEKSFYENQAELNRQILQREQLYAPLLKSVVKKKDCTVEEAGGLKCLAVDLHTRTRKAAEYAKVLPKRVVVDVLRAAISRGDLPPVPDGEKLEEVFDFSGAPGHAMQFSLMAMFEMNTMECKLLLASGADFFVTSDNPSALLNQFCAHLQDTSGVTGFSKAGLQLVLPLSPQLCFFCYDPRVYKVGNRKERVVSLSKADVEIVNSIQIQSAEECLYFHDKTRETEVRRLVDRFRKLRLPIEDSLREIRHGKDTLLHSRHPAARLPAIWQFCLYKKRISVKPGDRREPIVTHLNEKLMEDIEKNPNGGNFKTRLARIIAAHPE